MKKTLLLGLLSFVVVASPCALSAQKQQKFMRSSLYTILVKSERQNQKLEEEANTQSSNAITSIARSLANTDEKRAMNADSISIVEVPQVEFLKIDIPNQFNDHNLGIRIIDFDGLSIGITEEEKAAAAGAKKKKGGFSKFAKGFGSALLGGNSAILNIDTVNEYIPAVMNRFFASENIPENIVAKWFCYDSNADTRWSESLVFERGMQNATEEEKAVAREAGISQAIIAGAGHELVGNTYVAAINLRFRSNQAIMAEAQAIADAAGSQFGSYGQLASMAAGATAGAIVGDGFSVEAHTHLFRLDWNDEVSNTFAESIYFKNASLEDFITMGICKLRYLGKVKATARVRQSILSDKPMTDLARRATARAIDAAICKLQVEHEEFRTMAPITKVDGNGFIYAQIGMKEGVEKDDEYEILETIEDENGNIVEYKSVGTAKAVGGQIWNNMYEADIEAAENANTTEKVEDADKEADNAVALGMTAFKTKKKDDFTGYLIRLKKKK